MFNHIAGCPEDDYDILPISQACVKLYPDYLTWNESYAACQSLGATLPILNTEILFSEFRYYMDNVAIASKITIYKLDTINVKINIRQTIIITHVR